MFKETELRTKLRALLLDTPVYVGEIVYNDDEEKLTYSVSLCMRYGISFAEFSTVDISEDLLCITSVGDLNFHEFTKENLLKIIFNDLAELYIVSNA